MNKSSRAKWILVAAVAALPILAGQPSQAQTRVNQDGSALDANPQVGSGGYNSRFIPPRAFVPTGNQIVTGNVTNARSFRGQVPYVDQREFRGQIPTRGIDDFIKNSQGTPGPNQGYLLPGQSQPFYGSALATAPPPGFVQRGFTGTYTPPPQPLGRERGDRRLGGVLDATPFIYQSGTGILTPGPNDPLTNRPTFLTSSPLLGVRQWGLDDLTETRLPWGYSGPEVLSPGERLRLDPQAIQQMRQELAGLSDPLQQGGKESPAAKPLDAPVNAPLTPKPLGQEQRAPAGAGEQVKPGISFKLDAPPPAAQQSTQYAQMQQRLDRFYTQQLQTDEGRYREFLKQFRAKEAAEKAAAEKAAQAQAPVPGGPVDFGLPDYARISRELLEQARRATEPAQPGQAPPQAIAKPKPMQIESLAAGVRAEGLAKVMRSAEDLMKQGKFEDALKQYAVAQEVAPNNPLASLGQAHAELGAGYYLRADQRLRQALQNDPTLLMGQYDLKGMIGQQRLEAIVKDLKETARTQEKDDMPVFLLAYLAYNTGHEAQAADYLKLAEQRANGKDLFYRIVRLHWSLPGEQPADDARLK